MTSPGNLDAALAALARDGLVAFPTETVWGLAARAESAQAVRALHQWKGRAADQPISILVDAPERLEAHGILVSPLARRAMHAFWPGPCTLVLTCRQPQAFAPGIARADGAIGVRCSPHPAASRLVKAAFEQGLGPLTATSLNRHGEPAAQDRSQARATLEAARARPGTNGPSPLLLDTGDPDAGLGAPSSVLDLTGPEPKLLREGAIGAAEIESRLARGRTARGFPSRGDDPAAGVVHTGEPAAEAAEQKKS